jgi:hypothetical protein
MSFCNVTVIASDLYLFWSAWCGRKVLVVRVVSLCVCFTVNKWSVLCDCFVRQTNAVVWKCCKIEVRPYTNTAGADSIEWHSEVAFGGVKPFDKRWVSDKFTVGSYLGSLFPVGFEVLTALTVFKDKSCTKHIGQGIFVTLWTSVWEVLGLNLYPDTNCPESFFFFRVFPQL